MTVMKEQISNLVAWVSWICLILATPVYGHGGESMSKSNFIEVYADSRVSEECPFDKEVPNEIWDDTLKKSGLQLAAVEIDQGFLFAELQCFPVEGVEGEYNYSFFAQWTWLQGEVFPLRVLRLDYGRGDLDFLMNSVRELIEASVEKYLDANQ